MLHVFPALQRSSNAWKQGGGTTRELQNIPEDLYEATRLDGASGTSRFRL
jgi:hypothetical protein